MPDRYNTIIRIGGSVSRTTRSKSDPDESVLNRTVLNRLLGLINGAEVSHEFGDSVAILCEGEDDELLQYTNDNGLLEFKGESVPNGEYDELEEFLREEGIPYNRTCCAYGGYMAEDVYWIPGMDEPLVIFGDDHGTDYVQRDEVQRAIKELSLCRSEVDGKPIWIAAVKPLEKAFRLLLDVCPEIPDIREFSIVG